MSSENEMKPKENTEANKEPLLDVQHNCPKRYSPKCKIRRKKAETSKIGEHRHNADTPEQGGSRSSRAATCTDKMLVCLLVIDKVWSSEENNKNLNTHHDNKTEISGRESSEKQKRHDDRDPTGSLTAPPSGEPRWLPRSLFFLAMQKLQQFLSVFQAPGRSVPFSDSLDGDQTE